MFLKDERVAPDMAELWRHVELNVSSSRCSVELQQRWRDVGLLRSAHRKGTAVVPAGDHPGLYQQLGGSWVRENRENPHETGRRLRPHGQKSQLTINHDSKISTTLVGESKRRC